tara:strand:+ start:167 stop:1195 length:1029 start_codon:yes stop_codon:yes gene_type:complete
MLILNASDVRSLIGPQEAYDAVRAGFMHLASGGIQSFARHQLSAGGRYALMGLMPVADTEDGGPWAIKVVLVGKSNRSIGLDSHQGFLLLADGVTGVPVALIDASSITAMRTAAASAVATKALAPANPTRIAILGGGTQARSHAVAMRHLYPTAELVLWARSNGAELAKELKVTHAQSIDEAVDRAHVICTVTGAKEPILKLANVSEGCHINAVGASNPAAREIAGDLVAASKFVVDSFEQAESECGELLLARSEGVIAVDQQIISLDSVLSGAHPGRVSGQEITLFKSLGIATEDLALGKEVLKQAKVRGIGINVDMQGSRKGSSPLQQSVFGSNRNHSNL